MTNSNIFTLTAETEFMQTSHNVNWTFLTARFSHKVITDVRQKA